MKRAWKPGDVAMAAGERVIYTDNDLSPWTWALTGAPAHRQDRVEEEARPLVVIDPEDREQVDRLAKAMHESDHIASWHDLHNETRSQIKDAMQAALRSLVEPPRPEEPTGHMAVIEDRKGDRWVNWRDPRRSGHHERPWVNTHDSEDARDYADIDVVRVLSEGVQP